MRRRIIGMDIGGLSALCHETRVWRHSKTRNRGWLSEARCWLFANHHHHVVRRLCRSNHLLSQKGTDMMSPQNRAELAPLVFEKKLSFAIMRVSNERRECTRVVRTSKDSFRVRGLDAKIRRRSCHRAYQSLLLKAARKCYLQPVTS